MRDGSVTVSIEVRFDDGSVHAGQLDVPIEPGTDDAGDLTMVISAPGDRVSLAAAELRRVVGAELDHTLTQVVPSADVDAMIDEFVNEALGISSTSQRHGPAVAVPSAPQRRKFDAFVASPVREESLRAVRAYVAAAGAVFERDALGRRWGVTVGTGTAGTITVNVGRASVFWVDSDGMAHVILEGTAPETPPPFVAEIGTGMRIPPDNYRASVALDQLDVAFADATFRAGLRSRIEHTWDGHLQANWHNPLTETLDWASG